MIELRNSFTIPASVDAAWAVLLDFERVAPCMPGATLESIDGDRFEGALRVKLGAMVLTYRGAAQIVEQDDVAHRAVIEGTGKEARGASVARAVVTTVLQERGDHTEVSVSTDLEVTGKPAQFGRGIMAEVAERLIDQFAQRLQEELGRGSAPAASAGAAAPDAQPAGDAQPSGDAAPSAAPLATRRVLPEREPDEPLDVLAVAGLPVAKRAAAAVAALLGLVLLWQARARRRQAASEPRLILVTILDGRSAGPGGA